VVTDYYIAGFLPMVGEFLSGLMVEFKNSEGEIIALDDAIVMRNESEELKVWQTVAEYALSFGDGEDAGSLPEIYAETGNRLVIVDARSLWFWPVILFLLLLLGITGIYLYKRKRA